SDVAVYVGGAQGTIVSRVDDPGVPGAGIVLFTPPALSAPGVYDVILSANKDGVVEHSSLRGGLLVDAPIVIDRVVPQWGPRSGGTTVTITGQGFEPGTSVSEGTTVLFGDVPARAIRVLSTTTMLVTTPSNRTGRVAVRARDRYGATSTLPESTGFGFGLKRLSSKTMDVFPTDIIVDPATGNTIVTGGPFRTHNVAFGPEGSLQLNASRTNGWARVEGHILAEVPAAASLDIQDPLRPTLVGATALDNISPLALKAEVERLERVAYDSAAIHPAVDWELGQQGTLQGLSRGYVALGAGGIGYVNLDDRINLPLLAHAEVSGGITNDVEALGSAVLVSSFQGTADTPKKVCASGGPSAKVEGRGHSIVSFADRMDPVRILPSDHRGLIEDASLAPDQRGTALVIHGSRVFHGGGGASFGNNRGKEETRPCWYTYPGGSWAPAGSGSESKVWTSSLEPGVPLRTYDFGSGNVTDIAVYGDYLLASLAGHGVGVSPIDDSALATTIALGADVHASPGATASLVRAGNLFFVAAASGGVYVLDMSDPMAPELVSAGNTEHIRDLAIYKGRVVGVSEASGVQQLDLPGAVLVDAPAPGTLYADGESIEVRFSESMRTSTVEAALTVEDSFGASVPATVIALDPSEDTVSASAYTIDFVRAPGERYSISIASSADTMRGTKLWRAFSTVIEAAPSGHQRPDVRLVSGGVFTQGDQPQITVFGANFRESPDVKVLVAGAEVPYTRVSDTELTIAPAALELAVTGFIAQPMAPGMYGLVVEDGPFVDRDVGALVVGAPHEATSYSMSPESGPTSGGFDVSITASASSILPGARVVMISRTDGTQYLDDAATVDFHKDVETMRELTFRAPGVLVPDIFDVFVEMGEGETRVLVGQLSYEREDGNNYPLPGYPPKDIGALELQGDTLFVGVKNGESASPYNRFALQYGLELFDMSIWERPIRLGQMKTAHPVGGVEASGEVVYLAGGADGLLVASVHDPANPYVLSSIPVPGMSATDVALDEGTGVLALSLVGEQGGSIRFIDTRHPDLAPPITHATINFNSSSVSGAPLDVEWHGGELYVLLRQGEDLALVIYSGFGVSSVAHRVLELDRLDAPVREDLNVSLHVDAGRVILLHVYAETIGLATGAASVVKRQIVSYALEECPSAGSLMCALPTYWKTVVLGGNTGPKPSALLRAGGSMYATSLEGIQHIRLPGFVVAALSPDSGSVLGHGAIVTASFSELINTTAAAVAEGV
ncbi:MAG: IPT/TIG domain-containing protein, partial [Myxococcota bacterium]